MILVTAAVVSGILSSVCLALMALEVRVCMCVCVRCESTPLAVGYHTIMDGRSHLHIVPAGSILL